MEIIFILIVISLWVTGITFGVILCKKNNAWGVLLLFFTLFLLGLLIGIIIIYNARQKLNNYYIKNENTTSTAKNSMID